MSIVLNVKVNNQSNISTVLVPNGKVIVTWDWIEQPIAIPNAVSGTSFVSFIDQSSYEVRIGSSSANLGTNTFSGDLDTLATTTPARQYRYRGPTLTRGQTYYGQVKIVDEQGNSSGWVTFQFKYNTLPKVTSAQILPSAPTLTSNLVLSYTFYDADGDLEGQSAIRWYKNGVHQRQFDNQTLINASFLSYNDVWSADILPNDSLEFGPRFTTTSVSIQTSPPVGDNLSILPSLPNENDILKAQYTISTDTEVDKSQIRWFVNGTLVPQFNDQQFVRLPVNAGDQVNYQLIPFDGVTYGSVLSSTTVTISSSDFVVSNLRVEGLSEALALPTTRPIFSWVVYSPKGKSVQYVSVKIGTFAGSGNIYTTTLNSNTTTFQMPANLLRRGCDYFVSVAVSDGMMFGSYAVQPFRLSGSLWEENVNNATGWTIETAFVLPTAGVYAPDHYQIVRFQDGTNFGEVRIYQDRFSFASASVLTSQAFALTNVNILTIAGQGHDVKVYLNRQLIIDATGAFTQPSTSKSLEIGTVTTGSLAINYRSFYYTVDGRYYPGDAAWKNIQFYSFADFKANGLSAIEGMLINGSNVKVIGVNPHDETQGGSVYLLGQDQPSRFPTVNQTLTPVNRISLSLDQKYKAFSHARGGSIFYSYLVPNWDHQSDFVDSDSVLPSQNGWELVQNADPKTINLSSAGMLIDTSYANIGRRNE